MSKIDLNCDVGEGNGFTHTINDAALFPYVSSVNIACGFHAGDPITMRRTVEGAAAAGVAIGAHPGLPDRSGFGRRMMDVSAEDVYTDTLYQIGALAAIAAARGTSVSHVKPHGALYHLLSKNHHLAAAFIQAIADVDAHMMVMGPPGSALLEEANRVGLPIAREGFVDRRYRSDGTLVPRTEANSLHHEVQQMITQALRLALGEPLSSVGGEQIHVAVDTLCLHGDTPGAGELAKSIHDALGHAGIAIQAVHSREDSQ